jgi:nucleoside-diphosphate-sugar epimerase
MPTTTSSLVIGGTGVTGIPLVNGLLSRGHIVTIINSGTHPPPRDMAPWYFDGSVKKIVAIANKEASLKDALGSR